MKLLFTGDVVISNLDSASSLLGDKLRGLTDDVDFKCCNFEAPIMEGNEAPKVGPHNHNCLATIDCLIKEGFNLFALANNHIYDYGARGLEKTKEAIISRGGGYIGAGLDRDEVYRPYILKKNGEKAAIINAAEGGFGMSTRENESGYAYLFDPEIEKNIRELKEKGLPVIVVCHAGAEGFQYPLPEIRDTYRCLIDYGADVIIAHHPHVPQGVERYKGKKIYYSLGNFAFDKGNGALNPNTYCVIVNIENCELVNTDILFTTYADGKVDVLDDKDEIKKILALDSYLKDDNYSQYIAEVNEFCLNKYHNNYLRCYQRVPYVYDGAIGILKGLFRRIVQRKKMNEVMLFHNIEIETHFWIVRRALRLKMGNLVH